jgi:hypothetical protein
MIEHERLWRQRPPIAADVARLHLQLKRVRCVTRPSDPHDARCGRESLQSGGIPLAQSGGMTAMIRPSAPDSTRSRPQGILARQGIAQALGALFWALVVVVISFWV